MGQIRKQVIQSSFLSYIGFVIGAINTYFFTKQGIFTPEQYGLTQVIISMMGIIAPLATFGMTGFINRFFPYYYAHTSKDKNDMLTVAVLFASIGALLVFSGCIYFKPLVVRKFSARSAMVVQFYYWTLLFSFSYFCFMILESYLHSLKRTVLPNFMKETFIRICISILIVLFAFRIIEFDLFVVLFCCIYVLIVLILITYLLVSGQLYFSLRFSSVTKRMKKSMFQYVGMIYTGIAVNGISRQIDTLVIAGNKSLQDAGVYSLNQFIAAILQVPQRGLLAIAAPHITENWKNKNYAENMRIYQRSSINLLLIGCFLFFNIWLNYNDGLHFLGLDTKFSTGKTVFLILGLSNVFDLAVGVTAALIITSPYWKFEFYCNVILLALSIPLNIILVRWKGMDGAAMANLITFIVYNIIRLIFIRYRLKMWPFTRKTVYALVLVAGSYLLTWLLLQHIHGLPGMLLRSTLFSGLFFAGVFYFQLTPDLPQFLAIVRNRLTRKK